QLDRYRDWAIVASARAPGRHMIVSSLERYPTDSAWGVSPQIIPNYLLHSTSGLLSVALGMAGPNIGAGGIDGREFEAFLAATPFLKDGVTPGTWIVLAGWRDDVCRAVAVGLQSISSQERTSARHPRIRLDDHEHAAQDAPPFTLEALHDLM